VPGLRSSRRLNHTAVRMIGSSTAPPIVSGEGRYPRFLCHSKGSRGYRPELPCEGRGRYDGWAQRRSVDQLRWVVSITSIEPLAPDRTEALLVGQIHPACQRRGSNRRHVAFRNDQPILGWRNASVGHDRAAELLCLCRGRRASILCLQVVSHTSAPTRCVKITPSSCRACARI